MANVMNLLEHCIYDLLVLRIFQYIAMNAADVIQFGVANHYR